MTAILLALCLIGPAPTPDAKLYVGSHPNTWEAVRVRQELSADLWVNANFNVIYTEEQFLHPKLRFSRFGEWTEFPHPADSPNGAFCTRGLAVGWLKPELEKHLAQRNPFAENTDNEPEWSPLASQWKREWFYSREKEPQQLTVFPETFRFLGPVPAPRAEEKGGE